MNDFVRYFIQDHLDDIDNNQFDHLYVQAADKFSDNFQLIGQLTAIFTRSEINPLLHLSSIPAGYSFDNQFLTNLIIPDHISLVCNNAFQFCEQLKAVKLSNKIAVIPERCFDSCSNLEEIEFPDSIRWLHASAFTGCIRLKKVKLNEGLRVIESYAFHNSGLAEIELPKSLIDVGVDVFPSACTIKTYHNARYLYKLHNYNVEFLD